MQTDSCCTWYHAVTSTLIPFFHSTFHFDYLFHRSPCTHYHWTAFHGLWDYRRIILLLAVTFLARFSFLRATAVPAGTAVARISYGDSVCLSVRPSVTTRWYTKTGWDRDPGSSPCDSLEYLVSNEVILVPLDEEIPLERGHQKGYPVRNRYFTHIGSSSVKTVADRHRLAAYHSKHCRRAFQWKIKRLAKVCALWVLRVVIVIRPIVIRLYYSVTYIVQCDSPRTF